MDYADAKLWLNEGWLDYWTPQLYWKPGAAAQPYEPLLTWWIDENTLDRNIYPGLFTSKVDPTRTGWDPHEIINQILIVHEYHIGADATSPGVGQMMEHTTE